MPELIFHKSNNRPNQYWEWHFFIQGALKSTDPARAWASGKRFLHFLMRWFFKAIWSLLNLILLRLDGIAFTGAEITPYYDSLLGKILLSWKLLALVLFIKFKIISILTFYLKIKYHFSFSSVKVIAKGMTFQDAASKMRRALTEFRKINPKLLNFPQFSKNLMGNWQQ